MSLRDYTAARIPADWLPPIGENDREFYGPAFSPSGDKMAYTLVDREGANTVCVFQTSDGVLLDSFPIENGQSPAADPVFLEENLLLVSGTAIAGCDYFCYVITLS